MSSAGFGPDLVGTDLQGIDVERLPEAHKTVGIFVVQIEIEKRSTAPRFDYRREIRLRVQGGPLCDDFRICSGVVRARTPGQHRFATLVDRDDPESPARHIESNLKFAAQPRRLVFAGFNLIPALSRPKKRDVVLEIVSGKVCVHSSPPKKFSRGAVQEDRQDV
ncbi:hypothetical protein ES705_44654 [subsurface metagenome]